MFLKFCVSQIVHFSNVAILKSSISQIQHFSNRAFLKWSNSQMEQFSNGAFLKWSISQMEQFSNRTFLKWSISQMKQFSNRTFLKWSISQMEQFSNRTFLKWSNSQMEHFGVATLCHISRSQEQRNMACDVLSHFWALSAFFNNFRQKILYFATKESLISLFCNKTMFKYAKNVRLASFLALTCSLRLSLALSGSYWISPCLSMALCDTHSGSLWLPLAPSGSNLLS